MKLNANVKHNPVSYPEIDLKLEPNVHLGQQDAIQLKQKEFQSRQENTTVYRKILTSKEYQGMVMQDRILIRSPISGVIVPIEQVPDQAFSEKIVGVGIAIDPIEEEIRAPCNGTISQLHPSGHAVAMITQEKVEILIHIGLDTVKLKGLGFQPLVHKGMEVTLGQPLIKFNADLIAQQAKSLLTEIVFTNQDQIKELRILTGNEVKTNEPLFLVQLVEDKISDISKIHSLGKSKLKSRLIDISSPSGIHARPAAIIANFSKKLNSEIFLVKGNRSANIKSLTSIMGLEVSQGDQVYLEATGSDAAYAIENITRILQEGVEESNKNINEHVVQQPKLLVHASSRQGLYSGIIASPGYAVGRIFQLRTVDRLINNLVPENGGPLEYERKRLTDAIDIAKNELQVIVNKLKTEADAKRALIFSAHQELLDDPSIMEIANNKLLEGKSAELAWKTAFTEISSQLKTLNNQLLAARAMDVQDVGQRVLLHLIGALNLPQIMYPDQCILTCEELAPSDVANLDRGKVLGLVTTTGGATSHVAILARSLEIPALAGVSPEILTVKDGTLLLLDANNGTLQTDPSLEELDRIESKKIDLERKKKEELAHALEPAITQDGRRIEVVANLKSKTEVSMAIEQGAEGVGLLRTEFLFMNRNDAPSEEEQSDAYLTIAHGLGNERPLIIRTLDVGGDKPLKYLPVQREDNPFLGERGIRISLDRPEIFRIQLRAILRAAHITNVSVMFPMISTLNEIKQAKAILEEERLKLNIEKIRVGIMVEVPSVAILAEKFAQEVDFFSIGSNDLAQYTLAIDRGHPKLAAQVDGLDPSLLHLINISVAAAHKFGKWVGICGGIASDPDAVPILLGLKIDELSVSIPAIPSIKAQIRALSQEKCEKLAQRALNATSAAEIRSWVKRKE